MLFMLLLYHLVQTFGRNYFWLHYLMLRNADWEVNGQLKVKIANLMNQSYWLAIQNYLHAANFFLEWIELHVAFNQSWVRCESRFDCFVIAPVQAINRAEGRDWVEHQMVNHRWMGDAAEIAAPALVPVPIRLERLIVTRPDTLRPTRTNLTTGTIHFYFFKNFFSLEGSLSFFVPNGKSAINQSSTSTDSEYLYLSQNWFNAIHIINEIY